MMYYVRGKKGWMACAKRFFRNADSVQRQKKKNTGMRTKPAGKPGNPETAKMEGIYEQENQQTARI